ncbi:MAG: hypothetical protein ACFFCS_05005 [Candidatus Hodarchaeota archaeon]
MGNKRKPVKGKVLAVMLIASLFIGFASVMGNTTAITPVSSDALDMSGAIDIGDPFGVCHGGNIAFMKEIGINLTRNDITWTGIEPLDDNWQWGGWDSHVGNLQANDLRVLPILDYSNPAVQHNHTSYNVIWSDYDINEWLEYVDNCVERYYTNNSNYVDTWEIWNEPNIGEPNWWNPGFWTGTDDQFFELQKRTAANLTANPLLTDLKIMSSGISGHNPDYLSAMFEYGAMENIDILAFHPYSGSSYDSLDVKINEVKDVCTKYDFNGEIWITEVGMATAFNTSEPDFEEKYKTSLDLQGTLVPKVYAISLAMGIEHVVWYCLFDGNNWTWGEHNFGLAYDSSNVKKPADYQNETLKPAGHAYKAIAHNLNHSKYIPNGVQYNNAFLSSSWLRSFYFLRGNRITVICWNAANLPVEAKIPLPAGSQVQIISSPSYREKDSVNYSTTADMNKISVTFDFDPKILLIDLPLSSDPIPIQMEFEFTFYDFTLIIAIPSLAGLCIVMFVVRSGIFKKKKGSPDQMGKTE